MRGELDNLILGNPEALPMRTPRAPRETPRALPLSEAKPQNEAARVVAPLSPEAPQRPSHEAEITGKSRKSPEKPVPEEKPRPSASLLMKVLNGLSEAYHRAFTRARAPIETQPVSELPRTETPVPSPDAKPEQQPRETLRDKLQREAAERGETIGNTPTPKQQQTLRRLLERRLHRDPDDPEP